MAENDIYNSKLKYETFKENLENLVKKPGYKLKNRKGKKGPKRRLGKYYCKNSINLKYFRILFNKFEVNDLSYIRRVRLLESMKIIVYIIEKDLAKVDRDDIDELMKFVNNIYSPRTRSDFIADLKYIWKTLFPEKDNKDRIDETIVPYAVRHLSRKIDKSREKLRNDRLTWEEFENLVDYFNDDPKLQAYLMLSFESLGRPQEILYTKIKDVELYDNYAKVLVSEHGKEGTKFLVAIDSYPFLIKLLESHPYKNDKNCFLFTCYDKRNLKRQLTPKNINERIRTALKNLGINKPATCYSIKRNGITYRLLRGDSEKTIQALAGWTSTKVLKNYDLSKQEDVLKVELIKRGLIEDKNNEFPEFKMQVKTCFFCGHKGIKFNEDTCPNCKRILNREKILKQEEQQQNALLKLKQAIEILAMNLNEKTREELKRILQN